MTDHRFAERDTGDLEEPASKGVGRTAAPERHTGPSAITVKVFARANIVGCPTS